LPSFVRLASSYSLVFNRASCSRGVNKLWVSSEVRGRLGKWVEFVNGKRARDTCLMGDSYLLPSETVYNKWVRLLVWYSSGICDNCSILLGSGDQAFHKGPIRRIEGPRQHQKAGVLNKEGDLEEIKMPNKSNCVLYYLPTNSPMIYPVTLSNSERPLRVLCSRVPASSRPQKIISSDSTAQHVAWHRRTHI
jgi:hypothetical protein